jgi:hypothetical protein
MLNQLDAPLRSGLKHTQRISVLLSEKVSYGRTLHKAGSYHPVFWVEILNPITHFFLLRLKIVPHENFFHEKSFCGTLFSQSATVNGLFSVPNNLVLPNPPTFHTHIPA